MSMFPKVPEELINYIKNCKSAIVCGHMSPDGDCANSVMAMTYLLRKLGKECYAVNDGPFLDANIGDLQKLLGEAPEYLGFDEDTLGIVVDCGSIDRLGVFQNLYSQLDSIVIDHHASGQDFGLARYVVPQSPSTTLLVYQLYKQMNVEIDEEIATLLFRGFITDTGYFRFLSKGCEEIFNVVADIVSYGISPNNEYALMTGGQPAASLKFLGKLLDRTEYYFDNKLLITHEEESDYKEFNCATPTNEYYQHALTIKDCSVVASLKISKKKEGCIEVGFRSQHNSPVDVGKLALSLGGGGHAHASGATIPGTMDEVKKIITDAIGKQL